MSSQKVSTFKRVHLENVGLDGLFFLYNAFASEYPESLSPHWHKLAAFKTCYEIFIGNFLVLLLGVPDSPTVCQRWPAYSCTSNSIGLVKSHKILVLSFQCFTLVTTFIIYFLTCTNTAGFSEVSQVHFKVGCPSWHTLKGFEPWTLWQTQRPYLLRPLAIMEI